MQKKQENSAQAKHECLQEENYVGGRRRPQGLTSIDTSVKEHAGDGLERQFTALEVEEEVSSAARRKSSIHNVQPVIAFQSRKRLEAERQVPPQVDGPDFARYQAMYPPERRTTATFRQEGLVLRPNGLLPPEETIYEQPVPRSQDLDMHESSQSQVTISEKMALALRGQSHQSSQSQQARKPAELTDNSKSNQSCRGLGDTAEAVNRPIEQPGYLQYPRRGTMSKKKRQPVSKKKKYRDLDECAHTRYRLYFADDVVQHGLRTKNEVQHLLHAGKMDRKFEKDLREKEGIFFAIDVRPTSPRKHHQKDSVLRPFSRDPNKGKSDNSISEQSSAMKNLGQNYYAQDSDLYRHQGTFGQSYEEQARMQVSPTFKQSMSRDKESKQQFFTGESPTSSPKRNSSPEMIQKAQQQPSSDHKAEIPERQLRPRRSTEDLELSEQDSLVDLEEMLVSNQNSSRQLVPDGRTRSRPATQPQDAEDQVPADVLEVTVKKNNQDPWVQEVNATVTVPEARQVGNNQLQDLEVEERPEASPSSGGSRGGGGRNLRKLGSFLLTNYDSPNLMDIMKERRLHEIEEIDRRVSSKQLQRGKFQACQGSEGSAGRPDTVAMLAAASRAQKQQHQEALWYGGAPDVAATGGQINMNEAHPVVNSRNGADGDMEVLTFPMVNMEREVSFKKVDKYNNKFIQTQDAPNANDGLNRAAKSDRETAHQQFDGYGNMAMQRSDTKRLASSNLFAEEMRNVPPEPKSSLLREDRKIGRCSTVLIDQGGGFKQRERSTSRNLKNSQDLSANCSNESASSTSSQQSSNKIFHANMQLYKMKSIVTNKVSVGGRKLDRQAELRNRREDLSLCKDSVQDSQLQKDINNEPYKINKDLGQLSSKRQRSQNLGSFTYVNALTQNTTMSKNMPTYKKPRPSALNIKKNETVEPYFISLALDSTGFSNMQKTSVRKESVSKSKKTGDRSLVAQRSSNRDPQLPQSKQSTRLGNTQLRRQRRKDMRQFKKFLKDWPVFPSKEEREEEEIVQKQVRGLNKLKELCELLKGQPITTNCYNGGDNAADDNDLSNNDATTNGAADQYYMHNLPMDGAQLGHYLHSHGSKDPSGSASTPGHARNRYTNNQVKEHQTAFKASNNELGQYLRQIEDGNAQAGRSTMLSASKSEYLFQDIQEDGGPARKQTMNDTVKRKKKTMDQDSSFSKQDDFLDYHMANERERGQANVERERASRRRQEFQRQRQETVSISGYNEDHKFSLNVRDVDFSQISNNKSNDVSNKSIGSVEEATPAQLADTRKQGASNNGDDRRFSTSRAGPLGAETTSSRNAGQLQPQASHQDFSRSRDGSDRSDFMRKGLEALDRRVFDHRETFGQPFLQLGEKMNSAKLNQNYGHSRPPKTIQDYQGADRLEDDAQESQLFLNKRVDRAEAFGVQTQGHDFVSIQDRDRLLSVPEASQSTMNHPNQNANNMNLFDPTRHGDESSLSVPFSPYLPSGDVNSSEQQSFSPSVLEQSLAWKSGMQKPLISEMQSPIHLISDGVAPDQPLSLGCPQRSSNLDRGASQESLGQVAQRQGHASGRPRPPPSQSHKPFGLKIYELDMEVEQSRRANEEIAPSNATEQNVAGSPPPQHEGSEQLMDVIQSPQFQGEEDPIDRDALPGSSLQKQHPQTSPMNIGTSPLVDDSVLEQQLANFKPVMKKNAQSHHISPTNKRRLNINEATQAPAYIYKNVNYTSTNKRFQTSKNILKGPRVEPTGFSTNLDLLLSRNSRNERLSSNQMQGLSSVISGSESEFSFKKNPAFFSKERADKFEMSLNKMEGYSFKKIDSPHGNFAANEAYGSQQSISKASKTSLNHGSSLGKEFANSSNFMNDSKSSNQSREKKLQNQQQAQNAAAKTGISLNLMRCLKDIDRDIDQKIVGQQRTLARKGAAEQAQGKRVARDRSPGEQVPVSGQRAGQWVDETQPGATVSASRSQRSRAQAEKVERRTGGEQRTREKNVAQLANTEASCPQAREFDSSQPSEQSQAGARTYLQRANATNSAVQVTSAKTKYEQAYVQTMMKQQTAKEGKHAKGVLSEAERETRQLRPQNSKSQLSHLSEADVASKEQRSQSQTKARRTLNESSEKIQRIQMQISRTSKSNEALLTEQKTATSKQYGALEGSQSRAEAPSHSLEYSRARPNTIHHQDGRHLGASRQDGLGEKDQTAQYQGLASANLQEREDDDFHVQTPYLKPHFANRQSVIPNLNKQFSDVPDNKVARKKSEQNRPPGADASQMQNQHFLQVRGVDQTSISKGSILDQRANNLSKWPGRANLVVKTVVSDQSNRNDEQQQYLASTKLMVEDDLNELQSILDRHHRRTTTKQRRKKTKKRDGLEGPGVHGKRTGIDAITDVDVGLQSIYDDTYSQFGVTSYGQYNRRLEDGLEFPSNSKAPENRVQRPKYKLFQQSNNVQLNQHHQEDENAFLQGRHIQIVNVDNPSPAGLRSGGPPTQSAQSRVHHNFYKIEDDGTDKQSIFNGSESHLGDEFGDQHSKYPRVQAPMSKQVTWQERTRNNQSPGLTSQKSAAAQSAVTQSQHPYFIKAANQGAPSRQLVQFSKRPQPSQALNLDQQLSQFSSYSQSKRLGYSNFFQQKYVQPARQRSNSRNAGRRKSATSKPGAAQSIAGLRPLFVSQQVSAKGMAHQLLACETFSRESASYKPENERQQSIFMGYAPQAVLSMQPSLRKMAESAGQKYQHSEQHWPPGPHAPVNMATFTRMTSVADMARQAEDPNGQWQDAQNISEFLQSFNQVHDETQSMVLTPQTFSHQRPEARPRPEATQGNPQIVFNNTPFQLTHGAVVVEDQEEATPFGGTFEPEERASMPRSGKFGHSDSSKGHTLPGASILQPRPGNPGADGTHAVGDALDDGGSMRGGSNIHSGSRRASYRDGPHDEGRKSGGARGQLRENILQQMKEPRMPVYYENHDGPRFSLLSEMVQAQPYRPNGTIKSQKRTYQETINQQSAGRGPAADPDNPFSPSASEHSQSVLPASGDSNVNSGKTGHFVKQSIGVIAAQAAGLHNWQDRESHPERFQQRSPHRLADDGDSNAHATPFVLTLGTHMDSEPTQASYLRQRQQLMKKY